ncbi:MAG: hypothetical protein LBS89_06530, partial [Zoogloeaceae bacterium]|nr:hypothetical protein [Zoogloeaceae bacterium]
MSFCPWIPQQRRPAAFAFIHALALVFLLACSAAEAQMDSGGETTAPASAQIDALIKEGSQIYDIDAEGRVTLTVQALNQVLHERALENTKTVSIHYSRGIQ